MLDESNVLFVQDIQKNCKEPVWTSSSLFHLLSKGSGYGYILKYLNKSIGYILLRSLNDEEEILSLGVLKLNRRQGFASKLFYEFLGLKKIKVLKDYYRTDKGYEDGLLLSKVYF